MHSSAENVPLCDRGDKGVLISAKGCVEGYKPSALRGKLGPFVQTVSGGWWMAVVGAREAFYWTSE
jgi:hypothetical protein